MRVVVPEGCERRVLLHEMGHAAYGVAVAGLPWSVARAPARGFEEGVAELVAGGRGAEWWKWQVVRARVERAAYADPDGDVEGVWRDGARELVGREPRRRWWELEHLRTDPGAQVSYLVGEGVRRRVAAALGWPGTQAVVGLRKVMAMGARVGWRELMAGIGAAAL